MNTMKEVVNQLKQAYASIEDSEERVKTISDEQIIQLQQVFYNFRIQRISKQDLNSSVSSILKSQEEENYEGRILYPAAAYEALRKENAELKSEDEISAAVIEKCCNLLAQIAITLKGETEELARHGYHDLPELVAVLHLENELNKVQIQEMLTAMRRAVLALAFAAETSNAMKDDYNALSAAIAKAVASKNGE